MTEHKIKVNNIDLHYIEYHPNGHPTLILLHSLSANAHAFDGLVSHGLTNELRLISPDLRGRGMSSKPASHYTLEDHAKDILGLLDHLGIGQVLLGGHSFGALLSVYIATCHPERVKKLVILDAAAEINPNAPAMFGPSLSRLEKSFPSYEAFLEEMKIAPQNTFWDNDMESFYMADVCIQQDGTVRAAPNLYNILEAAVGVSTQPWMQTFEKVTQPALLVNGIDNYTMDEPVLPAAKAKETVKLMPRCRYEAVHGNHYTMLYGDNAVQVVRAVTGFLLDSDQKENNRV